MKSAPGQWGCDLLRVTVLLGGSTFVVKKRSGFYLVVRVDAAGSGVVSRAGGITLAEMVRVVGVDWALSGALTPWRKSTAVQDPAKVVCDLALMLAMGGCLADIALLRAEPGVFGPVALAPTVSRTVAALAADAPRALAAIDAARTQARAAAWRMAGRQAPDHGVDGTR